MGAIHNDWLQAVGGEFRKPYYKELYDFVKEEYSTRVIYPPADDIFNALHLTPLKEVKVVILGQDPYHNEHQAHGLSFSVLPDQREIPPSLQNIYKELHDDLGCYIPDNGYLEKWARQGVLMLNTVLTVRAHQANSHQGHGWEQFTDAILEAVNQEDIESTLMIGHENITLILLEMLTSLYFYRQKEDADPKPGPILTRIITPEMTITQHTSQNSSYTG